MKRLPRILMTFLLLNLVSCGFTERVKEWPPNTEEKDRWLEHSKKFKQNEVVVQIYYTRDSRTNLCFAYYKGHTGHGSALAVVPCDQVQKYLAPSQQSELGNAAH